MKRTFVLTLISLLLLSAGASAQSFRSGYFLDNYVYGYRINPAQLNKKSFLAIGLGNYDLQNSSGIGIASVLFPTDNGMVTGLNKAVSAEQFIGSLPPSVGLSFDENINLLSFGVRGKRTMHTFEVNLRTTVDAGLPRELFAFLKQGGDRPYDISGINLSASVIGDVSYGYARQVNKKLNIGGRLHFLVGAVDVRAYSDNSSVTMSESAAEINSELHLKTSGMVSIGIDSEGHIDPNTVNIDYMNGPYIGGYGAGLDFGAEYELVPGLNLMASVTEFGVMFRKNTTSLSANSTIRYEGGNISYQDGQVKTDDYQEVLDKLMEAIVFKEDAEASRVEVLPFNVCLGARYKLPFFKALSLGALGTYRYDNIYPTWEVRGGMTLSSKYFISISGNAGYGSYGPVCGGGLNLHLGPLNILAGVDSFIGDLGTISGISGVPAIPFPLHGFQINAHVGATLTF